MFCAVEALRQAGRIDAARKDVYEEGTISVSKDTRNVEFQKSLQAVKEQRKHFQFCWEDLLKISEV